MVVACGLLAHSAKADQLDDNLQAVWEVLWDQRGMPQRLTRWKKTDAPVRYRITGQHLNTNNAYIQTAMKAAGQASGLVFNDISDSPDAEKDAQIHFEIIKGIPDQPTFACVVQPQDYEGWNITKVKVLMVTREVWSCAHHEAMHILGIPGHPFGDTVLSYFKQRQDRLTALDRTIIQAWYSPEMPDGAYPFSALAVLTKFVVKNSDAKLSEGETKERVDKFLASTIRQMESFALGHGEVPQIIRRSGLASENAIAEAKREMAFMLGWAYYEGKVTSKSEVNAVQWFLRAAEAGHDVGQYLAGIAYFYGDGIGQNKQKGFYFLTKAAESPKSGLAALLSEFKKKLSPQDLLQLENSLKE